VGGRLCQKPRRDRDLNLEREVTQNCGTGGEEISKKEKRNAIK